MADVISNSEHITLSTHTPTRVQKHHTTTNIFTRYQISRCLTHYTIGHRGQLTYYHHTTYPSSPQLIYDMTTDYNKTDGHPPTTRKLTGHNLRKSAFAQNTIPTNIHTANIIFTNIILMEDKHNITKGKMHSNCRSTSIHTQQPHHIQQQNNIQTQTYCAKTNAWS